MIKAQLEKLLEVQKKENQNLRTRLENIDSEWQEKFEKEFHYAANSINISNRDYEHYQQLQETTMQAVERANQLSEANSELVKAIANLNGGVLKDLSQTIVSLTKKLESGRY